MLGLHARQLQNLITFREFIKPTFLRESSPTFQYLHDSWYRSNSSVTLNAPNTTSDDLNELLSSRGGGGGTPPAEQLSVDVGVLGVPNAGKSTLVNALAGTKVSAVSEKTNTTVRRRLGAFTSGATQVVLFDTPGIIGPGQNVALQQLKRIESAWKTAANCNILLLVVDAHRQLTLPDPRVLRLVESLGGGTVPGLSSTLRLPPLALVLNKVDNVKRELRPEMLALAKQFMNAAKFEEVFWVSALRGQGIDELRSYLLDNGTPGEWILPEDAHTDASEENIAAEIVREKIFRAYYQEIPYELKLVPVSFKTLVDGSLRLEMDIVVRSSSLKRIVVGRNGASIGSVGIAARTELEKLWKRRVHLFLNVKVM